ncbi:SURF1 family cytochrome oxidase biogenesis protein [Nocardia sp. FBN12]|uniref:SURF1 family cytochrome oxidase biogenesis protein n=1 Tax=Nocardia sp. FBN12 TaxID=3419766 RepID=UPI003CFF12FA
MRKLTFLLRPSWLILAVIVAAFAYLCFTVLAPWQLGKNDSTEHRNQLIADSVRADPVAVTDVLDNAGSHTEWRKVTATGAFVPESTVLVRLRHLDGAPGYAVLAAFRLDDGRTLLVDRGLVAAVDGTRPPAIADPPAGPHRIEARVRASEGVVPDKLPSTQDGYRQVYTVDTTQESTVLDTPLTPIPTGTDKGGYLQLAEGQPGAFTPTPLPQLDAGPYLSYGLQWLAFGLMAPLGLGYFVVAELRARRRDRAGSSSSAESGPTSTTGPELPPKTTTEARLADRYGR